MHFTSRIDNKYQIHHEIKNGTNFYRFNHWDTPNLSPKLRKMKKSVIKILLYSLISALNKILGYAPPNDLLVLANLLVNLQQ